MVHRYLRAERAMGYLKGPSAAGGLGRAGIDGEDLAAQLRTVAATSPLAT